MAGLAAASSVALFLVLARSMTPAEFGFCAIWFNIVSFLAVVSVGGQELLIVRSLNEYLTDNRPDLARGAVRFGFRVSLAGSLLCAAGLAAAGWFLGLRPWLLASLCLFVIAQGLTLYTSQVARVVAGIPAGTIHRELTWRFLVIGAVFLAAFAQRPFTPEDFFAITVAGIVLAAGLQTRSIRRHLPREVLARPPQARVQEWRHRSLRNWGAALVEASSQYLDVVVIGIVLSPTDAGVFFAISKIAGVFSIATNGCGLYAARRMPTLFFAGQQVALQRLLRLLAGAMTAIVAAGLTLVLLGGEFILGLFGSVYRTHAELLLLLCLGTAATALGGPAPLLLLTTGQEGSYLSVLTVSQLVRYALLASLALTAGLTGAVVAYALVLTGTAIAINLLCRRRLGLDPSAFALVGSRR